MSIEELPTSKIEVVPEKETIYLSGVEAVLKYNRLRELAEGEGLFPLFEAYLKENEDTSSMSIKKNERRNEEHTTIKIKDPHYSGKPLVTIFIIWNPDMEPEINVNLGFNPDIERAGLFIKEMNITASPSVIKNLL